MEIITNDRTLKFEFPGIILPHADADYANSMGYIKFKIPPKIGINDPTIVTNRAFIYFDYNPAVETNTIINTLTANLVNIIEIKNNFKFEIYPNPSSGNFNVIYLLSQNKEGKLEVFDITGKVVYEMRLPQWSTLQQISLQQISKGIYAVKICSNEFSVVRKLIIAK